MKQYKIGLAIAAALITSMPVAFAQSIFSSSLDLFSLFVLNIFGSIPYTCLGLMIIFGGMMMISRVSMPTLWAIIIAFALSMLLSITYGEILLGLTFIGGIFYVITEGFAWAHA